MWHILVPCNPDSNSQEKTTHAKNEDGGADDHENFTDHERQRGDHLKSSRSQYFVQSSADAQNPERTHDLTARYPRTVLFGDQLRLQQSRNGDGVARDRRAREEQADV